MQERATGYGLIEGPLWDEERGLLFSDVTNGGVYALAADGTVSTVLEHRKGIGGMVHHADGGIVVGGRNICWKSFDGEGSKVMLDKDVTDTAIGFNDFTTDAAGRLYVGSLGFQVFSGDEEKPGHLHVIDLDGSVRTVSDGIILTNGMAFSPDGSRLYHSDARANIVRVYPVDDGKVGPWETFATFTDGHPDGLCVAEDGSVVVAAAFGDHVAVFAPDGTLQAKHEVPLPMVTSVAFGGEGLRDLYVVTGSGEGPRPNCGSVFVTSIGVAGLPVPPCRVAL
ncbi:SMP-30/gluconolactonase/LRE family protein [Minwuia sp.]|uniref:SMP-30/gluconolactonase/LRE family protein n=1 Tax=Minwuia sp. TaxID=2493630 RepID=UPI003A948F9E